MHKVATLGAILTKCLRVEFGAEVGNCRRQVNAEEKDIDYVFRLLDIPWWYYAIAILLGVVAWRDWKKPSLGLLIGYSVLLLAETVLIRKPFEGEHIKLELFWSWRALDVQREQILTNVIMFVPVGALAGCMWKWRGLWVAARLSIVIEFLQLLTARGLCEIDDIFHNMIGALIGTVLVIMGRKIKGEEEHRW